MTSTLCQKKVSENFVFCCKAQNFVHLGPYDVVQISPAFGSNAYQIMYGEPLDFQCQNFLIGQFMLPLLTLTLEV